MKFRIDQALDAFASAATGHFAGQVQGMQIAQENNNRQFNQALNIAQLQDQQKAREMQGRGDVLGMFGKQFENMTPDSQAAMLTKGTEWYQTGHTADPYRAPVTPTFPAEASQGLGMLSPALGSAMAEQGQNQPPVAKAPWGDVVLAGVGKKEVAALNKRYGEAAKILAKASPGNQNAMTASALITGVNLDPKTPEEYRDANRKLSQVSSLLAGAQFVDSSADIAGKGFRRKSWIEDHNTSLSSPPDEFLVEAPDLLKRYDEAVQRGEKLPPKLEAYRPEIAAMSQKYEAGDIEGALEDARQLQARMRVIGKSSQGERNQAFDNFLKAISNIRPEDLTDEMLATLVKDNPQLKGEKPETLRNFAKGQAKRALEKVQARIDKFDKNTSPAVVAAVIKEYNSLARVAGIATRLSVDQFKGLFDEKQIEKITKQAQAESAQTKARKDKATFKWDVEAARLANEEARKRIQNYDSQMRARDRQKGAADNSTLGLLRTRSAASAKAFKDYSNNPRYSIYFEPGFDPATTKIPRSEEEAIAIQLYRQWQQDDEQFKKAMKDSGKGQYTAPPVPRPKYNPPKIKPPAPEPKGPFQKMGEAVVEGGKTLYNRFVGKPAQPKPKAAPKKRNKYDGMSDEEFMRARPGLK